ncbi:maleylpyruvate isomerase N-terminal domain-containing protein [Chloroflexota bacterium]
MVAKDKLIQWLDQSHQRIAQLVDQVDRNLEIYQDWTIRDVLAHFTGWDDAVLASLKSFASGGVPTVVAGGDHNYQNAAAITRRQALSFDQIYQEWQHTHEQLKIAILDLPPEIIEDEFVFPWGQTGNVEDLVTGLTNEHEVIHMKDIEKLIGKDG